MYNINIPDGVTHKLVDRNFGSIKHLNGSKLIEVKDTYLDIEKQKYFTEQLRDKRTDKVIISEKIDGMNAGVIKLNNRIYPISRKGYDVRTLGVANHKTVYLAYCWAKWVNEHAYEYSQILENGDRLVFENCIVKHTLKYKFKGSPVFLLAMYRKDKQVSYEELTEIAKEYNLQLPPLINYGIALEPRTILSNYGKGLVGCKESTEGIVYRYETNKELIGYAKFVSNSKLGTVDSSLMDCNKFNYDFSADLDLDIALSLGIEMDKEYIKAFYNRQEQINKGVNSGL